MEMAEHLKTMLVGDVVFSMTDVSAELKFGKIVAHGTCGSVSKADDMSEAGQLMNADSEFVCDRAYFAKGMPEPRNVVEMAGVKYWVERVDDDGACVTLTLRRG